MRAVSPEGSEFQPLLSPAQANTHMETSLPVFQGLSPAAQDVGDQERDHSVLLSNLDDLLTAFWEANTSESSLGEPTWSADMHMRA